MTTANEPNPIEPEHPAAESGGALPRSVAQLNDAFSALMDSETIRTPPGADTLNALLAEARPHRLHGAIEEVVQTSVENGKCLTTVRFRTPVRIRGGQSDPSHRRIPVHPAAAATFREAETVDSLERLMHQADVRGDWDTVRAVLHALTEIFRRDNACSMRWQGRGPHP